MYRVSYMTYEIVGGARSGCQRPADAGGVNLGGAISENWRPYRTWVTLLLRTLLEDEATQRVKLSLARGCA